jgi:hypothetical protein
MPEFEFANVMQYVVKTEDEIRALGLNSIIKGQAWIASDSYRLLWRDADGAIQDVKAEATAISQNNAAGITAPVGRLVDEKGDLMQTASTPLGVSRDASSFVTQGFVQLEIINGTGSSAIITAGSKIHTNSLDYTRGAVSFLGGEAKMPSKVDYVGVVTADSTTVPAGGTVLVSAFVNIAPNIGDGFPVTAGQFIPQTFIDPAWPVGTRYFDANERTMNTVTDDVNIISGDEQTIKNRFKNETGVTIPKFRVVYIKGKTSDGFGFKMNLASYNTYSENWSLWVTTEDVIDGDYSTCIRLGALANMPTTGLNIGAENYLGLNGEIVAERLAPPGNNILIGTALNVGGAELFAVDIQQDNYDIELEGCVLEPQGIDWIESGGNVYVEIWNKDDPTRDLPIRVGGKDIILDTTTGAGTGGRARFQVAAGLATNPIKNCVYATNVGGAVQLNYAQDFPADGEFAEIAVGLLRDAPNVAIEKSIGSQIYTNAISRSGRGFFARLAESVRARGAQYWDGLAPSSTITDGGAAVDTLDATFALGRAYQLHLQSIPQLQVSVDGAYVMNASGAGVLTPYQKVTNLALCNEDTAGNSLNGQQTSLVLMLMVSSGGDTILGVFLPTGGYDPSGFDQENAYDDPRGFSTVSAPAQYKTIAMLGMRIPAEISNDGLDWTYLNPAGKTEWIDLRGVALGTRGTGGAAFGGVPTLLEVLTQSNDAGGLQIKSLGDGVDATDAMAYGQFTRYTVSSFSELKTAWEQTTSTEINIFVAQGITVPASASITVPHSNFVNIHGGTVFFAGNFTYTGTQETRIHSEVSFTAGTTLTLTTAGLSVRNLAAPDLTIIGAGLLQYEREVSIGILTGNSLQVFWTNTFADYPNTPYTTETGDENASRQGSALKSYDGDDAFQDIGTAVRAFHTPYLPLTVQGLETTDYKYVFVKINDPYTYTYLSFRLRVFDYLSTSPSWVDFLIGGYVHPTGGFYSKTAEQVGGNHGYTVDFQRDGIDAWIRVERTDGNDIGRVRTAVYDFVGATSSVVSQSTQKYWRENVSVSFSNTDFGYTSYGSIKTGFGTWTPNLTFGGGNVNMTYTSRGGSWTRVGRQVTVNFSIVLLAKGDSTGNVVIDGLPFDISDSVAGTSFEASGVLAYLTGMTGLDQMPHITASQNTSELRLTRMTIGGSNTEELTDAYFTNTSSIRGTITYISK